MPWESSLHSAARRGDSTAVSTLANAKNINTRSDWGFTPLNVACYCGHLDIIEFLLDLGADVNLDDGRGWTPLHAACQSDRTAAVKLLLDRGATDCVNSVSGNNGTPLYVACKSKCDRVGNIVKLLIDAGADVNARNPKGRTPLMEAAAKHHFKKVELLINAGADIHAVDEKGMSALHMSVSCHTILELLIDSGADINLRDYRGETPIERKDLSFESMRILLEHGAGTNIPCQRHKRCNGSILACLHKSKRATAKRGHGCDNYYTIERYIIKCEVAGLYAGPGLTLFSPPLDQSCWESFSRSKYREDCVAELKLMKDVKIPGSSCTYFNALLQRPCALKQVDPLLLQCCREQFPIYGDLIWNKFHSGRRKLPLIEDCIDFFTVMEEDPKLPPECVAEVLSYLSEKDLEVILSVYNSAMNQRSVEHPNEFNKRANPDSSLQVMKYLKVE